MEAGHSFAAIAVLVAAIGYQNFVTIREFAKVQPLWPRALPRTHSLPPGQEAPLGLRYGSRTQSIRHLCDIPGDPSFTSYGVDIVDRSRRDQVLHSRVGSEQIKDTVQLLIPGWNPRTRAIRSRDQGLQGGFPCRPRNHSTSVHSPYKVILGRKGSQNDTAEVFFV